LTKSAMLLPKKVNQQEVPCNRKRKRTNQTATIEKTKKKKNLQTFPKLEESEDEFLICGGNLETILKFEFEAEASPRNRETSWFDFQTDIRLSFRRKLLEWLYQIHYKYRLNKATFFLTVSLLDRYLNKEQLGRKKLQLVGSTCLWMASKYHDIHPLDGKSLSRLAQSSFSEADIVRMEYKVCVALDFNLTIPTPLIFIQRFLVEMREEPHIKSIQKCLAYVLDHILCDPHFVGRHASLKASIALYFTFLVFQKEFTSSWQELCRYQSSELLLEAKRLYKQITDLKQQNRISKTNSRVSKMICGPEIKKLFV